MPDNAFRQLRGLAVQESLEVFPLDCRQEQVAQLWDQVMSYLLNRSLRG
jgi:hypothetical protein